MTDTNPTITLAANPALAQFRCIFGCLCRNIRRPRHYLWTQEVLRNSVYLIGWQWLCLNIGPLAGDPAGKLGARRDEQECGGIGVRYPRFG